MKYGLFIMLCFALLISHAQTNPERLNRLKIQLGTSPSDSSRVLILADLSNYYNTVNVDSSKYFAVQALGLSTQLGYKRGISLSYLALGTLNLRTGNVPLTINYLEKSIQLADSIHDHKISSMGLSEMGLCMVHLEDYYRAIEYYKRALDYQNKVTDDDSYLVNIQMNIADAYLDNNNLKEAEYYLKRSLAWGEEKNSDFGWLLNMFGSWHIQQKNYAKADSVLQLAWTKIEKENDIFNKADNRYYFAKLKLAQGEIQAAHEYAKEALNYYQQTGFTFDLERIYKVLSIIESKRGRIQQSLDYLLLSNVLHDSTQNSRARNSALLFEKHEKENQKLLEQNKEALQKVTNRNQRIIIVASFLIFGIITIGLLLWIQQKQKSNEMLTKSNQTISELNSAKDRLFSIIGHDLKGPLNTLNAFFALVQNNADSITIDEVKKLSHDFDKSLKNSFSLLENLLEWSQSQTGAIDFKAEEFDLSIVLRENQELFKGLADNKNITIVNDNANALWVSAHRYSINTVVRNLLSNAIKFTHRGGVITLHTEHIGQLLKISITDNGVGISESVIQKLFKIGTKHSTPGTALEKGTGLGLLLCKDFVDKNGGKIGVESKEDKGSTFYFTIPLLT
ncbi:MAG: tetratricopeptide repeat-containing sensor histidine kinase [Chryseolinea sp.]